MIWQAPVVLVFDAWGTYGVLFVSVGVIQGFVSFGFWVVWGLFGVCVV